MTYIKHVCHLDLQIIILVQHLFFLSEPKCVQYVDGHLWKNLTVSVRKKYEYKRGNIYF